MTQPSPTQPRWIGAILLLLAALAILVPVLIVSRAPDVIPTARRVVRPQRVVPPAELPPVEPIAFQDLAPTDARAFNASIPFSTAPNPAARPFAFFGDEANRARALDCLAAAVLYEAGDDPTGERAVAQVVLNRVRHPAFPNSVCAVVFQGAERRTGCQFTFTCDGAILRAVRPEAWGRARAIARAALTGQVDRRVGHATHYHTDWVVPYWSSSLDKITEVHTHLFFRWTGWWGTPGAFRDRYTGTEPVVPQLARLSEAHRSGAEAAGLLTATLDPALLGDAALPKELAADTNTFLVTLDQRQAAETFPALAARACGERPYCKFMAWTSKAATPAALPVTPVQQRAMSFSYLRDQAFGFEKALWNCQEFKRPEPTQCMKAQLSITMAAPPPTSFSYDATPGSALKGIAAALPTAPAEPDPLTGVRRRSDPAAAVPMSGPAEVTPADPARRTPPPPTVSTVPKE
ncbi:Cell wall hydrolase CwlJ, involved in spore germination [Sphingomonas guangdongensis]|uniref:Cell wall hydrolase CwlJ, involved in spore germination n=1 Tax=Sphingomonas guangdongensis TaxID=1141890 RepID=A0A285R0V1_9SPHN|nr:cell wall hydrolase [Sphingomonas guangdongensis]SOB87721.1 Cell wall hydrolase CwlJ, involved in spore germination [Sphingomonas guangdongensis]